MRGFASARLVVPALAASLSVTVPVHAVSISGDGSAPVTKDLDTVRARAESDARRAIVVAMLKKTIGAERLNEVTPEQINALRSQLRSDMIVSRESLRDGGNFIVKLTAEIDQSWFQSLMGDEGIQTSSNRASGNRQLIFVMLDQVNGAGRDFAQPQEVNIEYDRASGGSFSDKSVVAASEKDRSASTSKRAGAYRSSGAAAYGASSAYGSVAGRSRGNTAGASSSSGASASSHSSAFIAKTNVQAEVHDDVRYREHVVYQRPAQNSPAGYALSALTGVLQDYDVTMADPDQALSSFFKGQAPRYNALRQSVRFSAFLSSLAQQRAPFFMGGTIAVQDAGRDGATNLARCTGNLDARAFATADSQMIAQGAVTASATGQTFEECEGKLANTLARGAADQIGPKIQRYWRGRASAIASAGQNTAQTADYALVLRASALDMAMQADIMDALQATPGVQSQNFVSQQGNEMRFQVRYAGAVPLQLALYQKLRVRPGFERMQSTVNGRSVLLCLAGCGPAQ